MIRSCLRFSTAPVQGRPIVLCFPGTMCSPAIFDPLEDSNELGLQFVAVSWMTSPGPWDLEHLGRRAVALIREFESGPVYLLGHSTGGVISLATAILEPRLVRGLLLSNTGANTQGHSDIHVGIKAVRERWGADLHARFIRRCFHYGPDPRLAQSLLSYAGTVRQEAVLEALESQAKLDLRPKLGQIRSPVVVVHGEHDRARPPAHAELLTRELPNAESVVLDAGHMPMVEDPAGFVAALRTLVSSAEDGRMTQPENEFCRQ